MGLFDRFKKNAAASEIESRLMALGYDRSYISGNDMNSLTADDVSLLENDETIRVFSEVIAKRKHAPFAKVFRQLRHAQEDYGIDPEYFGNNGLYRKSDDILAKHQEKRTARQEKAVDKVAKVTGWNIEKARAKTKQAYEKYGILPTLYYSHLYYNLTDEELADHIAEEEKEERRCREWVRSETGWTDYEITRHIHYCRIAFGINPGQYYPTRCWQMDDDTLKTFAAQRDSKKLRDKYNDKSMNAILANKIKFNQKFGEFTGRKYWVNRDTSFEEFLEFADGLDTLFCKPVDLSHASGTRKVKVEGDMRELYDQLMSEPRTLVEECVKQHHEMDEFYDNAVNTVRLFCVIDNDEFIPFAGFVRFGADGVADNIVAGGVGCGLNVETGRIDTPAIDRWHVFHDTHPVTGKTFMDFKIPNWEMVLDVAEKAMRKFDGINYVGWDIAVCEDKAVLIEGNTIPSIGTYQMFYGYRHEGKKYTYERFLK